MSPQTGCAVKRLWSTTGVKPARENGSLHPEAIHAAVEATRLPSVVGGFVPLSHYMLASRVHSALLLFVAVTRIALFVFGFVKARCTAFHWRPRCWRRLFGRLSSHELTSRFGHVYL